MAGSAQESIPYARARYLCWPRWSGASFIDDVEGGLCCSAKTGEPGAGYDVSDACLSGLRA